MIELLFGGLDMSVDGAVFGLNKAVKKLDKVSAFHHKRANKKWNKSAQLHTQGNVHDFEGSRALKIKKNLEALLQ